MTVPAYVGDETNFSGGLSILLSVVTVGGFAAIVFSASALISDWFIYKGYWAVNRKY